MKILYVITRAVPGGAQVHVLELLRRFRGRFEPILATGGEGFLTEAARDLGISVFVLPNLVRPINPIKDVQAVRELVKLIRTHKCDLVHAHSSKAGVLGRLAAQLAGVPSIYTDHGWAFAARLSWYLKLLSIPSEWLAAHWCRKIITNSKYDLGLALRYRIASPSKLVQVYYGIPDTPHRANPGKTDEVCIGMVARFNPQKNQNLLLHALSEVKLPFKLILVGDGPNLSQAQETARKLGLAERVEFLGSRQDVDKILSQVHISVLSTHWESFGLVSVEAMRSGLPVVSSDVGGVREVVVEGETGFLVPLDDVKAMRERLTQLIADAELRVRMGQAGRQHYEDNFTLDLMLNRTLDVYQGVLAN